MSREVLNLRQAAEHVHLAINELKHAAQRGEVEANRRGEEWYFEHRALDEWAQRNLLASGPKQLTEQHRVMMDEDRRAARAGWGVERFFRTDAIELSMSAKNKGGVIRDITDLAVRTGLVYDGDGLYRELTAREEVATTALEGGAAIPHPRFHDPYLFEDSFIAYARAERPVFFGSSDGEGTRHFFLVCSTDHEVHLHIIARLAVLIRDSSLLERLDAAEDPDAVMAAIGDCERPYCK